MTIDELNWLDGRLRRLQGPDRPWTILLRAHLTDPIDRAAVEQAWRAAVRARPALHVAPATDGDWRPWHRIDAEPLVHHGGLERELDRARHRPDDEAVTVVVDDDPATTISLVVDHALTDGLGARAMLEDLLRALSGEEIRPRPRVTDAALDSLRTRRLGLRAAIDQIPPRRVATLGETGATTHLASAVLDVAPIDERRRAGGPEDTLSVGTMIAGATLEALADQRPRGAKSGTVAAGIPVDLRRHLGDPTGLGNAVVNLTVSGPIRHDGRADLGALAASIAARTSRRRLAETLTWVKRATRPGVPRTVPRAGRDVATAMLSNLGRLGSDPAWQLVDHVEFAPPAHQTISIGVTGLHGRLAVTVRSRLRDSTATSDLVAALAGRLGSGAV